MGYEPVLRIVANGELTQASLQQLRDELSLHKRGRLTDAEDVVFGYRRVRFEGDRFDPVTVDPGQGIDHTVLVDLLRSGKGGWELTVDYLGTPPPEEFVEEYRARFRAAAARVGLVINRERRFSPSGG